MSVMIRIEADRNHRSCRAHFWRVILDIATPEQPTFTTAKVLAQCDAGAAGGLSAFIKHLMANGFLELAREPERSNSPRLYRLVRRQRETPCFGRDGRLSAHGHAQQQMWNVMRRAHQGFTCAGLAVEASTDEVQVSLENARLYCRHLEKAGILVVLGRSQAGHVKNVYVLKGSANTGPKAPACYQARFVYDRNTEQVVGMPVEASTVTP